MRSPDLSRLGHSWILMVAMVVLAAPLLANGAPVLIDNPGADRSDYDHAMTDDVD